MELIIMDFDKRKLAKRLKDLREEKNLTQDELSKILNVVRTNIGKYENGDIDLNTSLLVKYSEYFDCSPEYILGLEDNRNKSNNYNLISVNSELDFIELYEHYKKSNLSIEDMKEIMNIVEKMKIILLKGIDTR
jgi:transcriptional regulator with XRE-family HTH domain